MKNAIIASVALAAASSLSAQDFAFVAGWDFDQANAAAPSVLANWGSEIGSAEITWSHQPANPPFVFVSEFNIGNASNSAVTGNDFGFSDPGTGFDQFSDNFSANSEFGFRSNTADDVITINFDASGYENLELTYAVGSGGSFSLETVDLSALSGSADASFSFTAGVLDYDNFKITGTTIVPEPSTYAAIAGALALGFVAYRRRK